MTRWRDEWKWLVGLAAVFAACFFMPIGSARFEGAVLEALALVRWYAREHVILCLLPAFLIAGAIGIFVRQDAVMRYLGPAANRAVAYGVAAVSGTVLAVCSCTVLPLFAGIYRMGAGLGPACAFLYAGPAINVLAIVLTARVLGLEMGIARAVGAIVFSVVIGVAMHVLFRREEAERVAAKQIATGGAERPFWQPLLLFIALVGALISATWGEPSSEDGVWRTVYESKWALTAGFAVLLGIVLVLFYALPRWAPVLIAAPVAVAAWVAPTHPEVAFLVGMIGLAAVTSGRRDATGEWFASSWGFAKQITPLLFAGVAVAGLLLGQPGSDGGGLIPSEWVASLVGGNSLRANGSAAVIGALMYFATLTEIPILEGLIGSGMGKGPALALLLAGPALSLPNMLVIHSVMGFRKTLAFIVLVVVMATATGMIYGHLF
jgi:uncharacterized membrane protein YraQ (UPF0718 family)